MTGAARGDGEFSSLTEVADELRLDHRAIPPVRRESVAAGEGKRVSVVVWGEAEPELVFLHGGGQNARTWDLVALSLGRPAIAIDLPGHGHSSWRADRDYGPFRNAAAVAVAIQQLAARARGVVGMSLGGLTAIRLGATRPDLVRKALLVDVTPGSPEAAQRMNAAQRGPVQLTRGPRGFARLEDMVQAAVQASPHRAPSAVRRGVVHNARRLPDGTWAWRHDLGGLRSGSPLPDPGPLWADLERLAMPAMLVTGGNSGFVTDADRDEVARRLPSARIEVVPAAGHAVQSDQPRALSALIREFIL